jgi:hypothetical protein
MTQTVSSNARTHFDAEDIADIKDKLLALQVELLNRLENTKLQYNHALPFDIAE